MASLITRAIHQNGLDETRLIFSQRLVESRKIKGITAKELGERIAKKLGMDAFRVSTISTWENAHNLPRMSYIDATSSILDVDASYLLGLQDEKRVELAHGEKGLIEIKYDRLKDYSNQPVWCVSKCNEITEGFWGIVNSSNNTIVTSYQTIPFGRINFDIYTFLSPYSYAIDSDFTVLPKESVRQSKRVWVQGVGGSFVSRQKIKGYYEYNSKVDCVLNSSGILLSMDTYGVNWVAFDKEVIEPKPEKLL